ncbi:MAG: shikimate kinase [Marinilabilia sp.]
MQTNIVYLTGFMGSGKSTLGHILGRMLKYQFIDLDRLIEEKERATIPELFARFGEERFRELERLAVHETTKMAGTVIATGGGAPCFFDNMEVMNKNGTTVYLQLSPETLVRRLLPGQESRPLIAGKSEDELQAFIRDRLKERAPYYQKAHIIADTDKLSPEETARTIVQAMKWSQ